MQQDGDTLAVGDESRVPDTRGGAYLFLVIDGDRPLAPPARVALARVVEVAVGRGPERAVSVSGPERQRRVVIELPDGHVSKQHARLTPRRDRWIIEDAGSRNGLLVNGEKQTRHELVSGDVIELGHSFLLFKDALPAGPGDADVVDGATLRPPAAGLATLSPGLEREYARMIPLTRSPISLLVEAETGTGKELLARAVHQLSGRGDQPFVALNCGALPENLVETELFGYRKGAFSGAADDRVGLIRSAQGGTLFLDEIGDLPLASQAAFLRVLQEREVLPVGATRPVPVEFRLVAATHRSLARLVEQGGFRADLLNRVAGQRIALPRLRDRLEDLGLILGELLRRHDSDRVRLHPRVVRAFLRYDWPGNVRELEQCLAGALVLSPEGLVRFETLPAALTSGGGGGLASGEHRAPLRKLDTEIEELERSRIAQALEEAGGNKTKAAALIGMPLRTFQHRMRQYGLGRDKA